MNARAEPLAFLAVNPGSGLEKIVPIFDSLFVGRECIGIDDDHRLLIDDPEISRSHLEIRLDADREGATAVDLSTNGTRLNGTRIEKAQPVAIRGGDHLDLLDVAARAQQRNLRVVVVHAQKADACLATPR